MRKTYFTIAQGYEKYKFHHGNFKEKRESRGVNLHQEYGASKPPHS